MATARGNGQFMPPTKDPKAQAKKVYNVEKIRQEAKESLLAGAVTPDYRLPLKEAISYLNEALATEILCVLRYRHHQIVAKGINFPQVAAEFAEHAASEEQHMMKLAERIDQLGGDPDFNPATIAQRTATEYGTNSSLSQMIKEDLMSERVVIEVYRKLIPWFGEADPTTRRMLEDFLRDEEEHATDLADLLAAVDPREEPSDTKDAITTPPSFNSGQRRGEAPRSS